MRLWSLHPSLLDTKALVAGWREALLAQAVLAGKTKGYKHHPQLDRFKASRSPLKLLGAYLSALQTEAAARGYKFDASRILRPSRLKARIPLQRGQLAFEYEHLLRKSRQRSPAWARQLRDAKPRPHPLFKTVAGGIEAWERDAKAHA
jgi:hypothetical protein